MRNLQATKFTFLALIFWVNFLAHLQFPKLLYEVLAAGIALKQARLSNHISNIIDLNVLPHGLASLALVSRYLIS